MPPHHPQRDNVLPWPVADIPGRPVTHRAINPCELARLNGEDEAVQAIYEREAKRWRYDEEDDFAELIEATRDDLRIIGLGLLAAYLWVIFFRLTQVLS